MSGFTLLKRDCPICNGERADCRQSQLTDLIHCRDSQAASTEYVFRGLDSLGFGMWAMQTEATDISVAQREEWRRQKELEKQRRLKAEAQQRSQLLSEPERDRNIRKLLDQLGLDQLHRQDLQRRGLSDEQIKAGQFRSVGPWQKLEQEISHRLAGVNITGRGMNNPQTGYLCPIWNCKGQIVGWQLRLDDTEDGGKYRWPTSASQKRPDGPTSHLCNGELPITCCRPASVAQTEGIGLIEGILKPYLTAQLKSQIVLGAAGGNFASSPQTLKAYLDEVLAQTGTKQIILYPDAGAVNNSNVMRQYRRTYTLLKKWGYELRVAWWHQTAKGDLDIDELLAAGRGDEIEVITFAQFEAIAHNPNQLWESITDLFKGLKRRLDTGFKGFGQPPSLSQPSPPPTIIDYAPGHLSTISEYQALGNPRIRFKDGQRSQIWQEAIQKGWKHILDASAPGQGKSYTAGISHPEAFEVDKLWYFAANHRNPTTEVIERNYVDLPVRTSGMRRDTTHKTPLGHDWQVWPKNGDFADIPGNCHRARLFAAFRAKNIQGVEGGESPICQTCHLRDACRGSSGLGFGFRSDRRDALKSGRVRAHPDSAPQTDDFDFGATGAIWDEAGTLLKPMEQVTAVLADFDSFWIELEAKLPEIHTALRPLRLALRPLVAGELKQPHHGFDDAAIRALLPETPDNLQQMIEQVEAQMYPDLMPLLDSTSEYGVSLADLPDRIKKSFKEGRSELTDRIQQSVCLNWLVPFLQVWGGASGAFRCEFGKLSIFTRSARHSDLAAACGFNIYLDSTATSEYLGMALEVERVHILAIEQETPPPRNLQVIQVTGLGQVGKDRSESLTQRVTALKNELGDRHPDAIGFIDWKLVAACGEGAWFIDSRGTNDFLKQKVKALASFGVPYQNLGHLQALYQTLTGRYVSLSKDNPDPDFQKFVESHTQSEITQSIGRLRSHLRPDEQLTYYFCGDYNLSFLGLPVEQIEAFTITPEAGTAGQQTRWVLLQAARQLAEVGQQMTQATIATAAGLTQGRISQIAGEVGGWKIFKKILAVLLRSLYSTPNNLEPLGEEESWIAKTFLPLVFDEPPEQVLKEVVSLLKICGEQVFESILVAMPRELRPRLLGLLVGLLPPDVQEEFNAIALALEV